MAEVSLQEYIQEIEDAIEQGRYREVQAHGRHILQHYPKHLATYRLLGKAMLEAGQDELAEDMFQRVLSGDPEDFVSWVGMSIIRERQDDLQGAIWHLERAFELVSNNAAIQDELRGLYARRDGVESSRVQLTQGALARLYMQGNLLSRAVEEFRTILTREPKRVDVRVALAEALWRNEQRVQAEEACLRVLEELPHCLKANLILGTLWVGSGREEGRTHLRVAQALDPENQMAVELLGDASPLQLREVQIPYLEQVPQMEVGEQASWIATAAAETTPEGAERLTETGSLESRIEIPAWLKDIGAAEEAEEPESGIEEVAAAAERPSEEELGERLSEEAVLEAARGEPEDLDRPGDMGQLPPEVEEAEEIPDWLQEIEGAAAGGAEEAAEAEAWESPVFEEEGEELPDWLKEIGDEAARGPVAEEAAQPEPASLAEEPEQEGPVAAEIPDWLKEMAPPEVREEQPGEPLPEEELPGWLTQPQEEPSAEAEEVTVSGRPEDEGEELPPWLEEGELPSGDDALAWLESLAAGKEEELRTAAEAEGKARMAEIMGRREEEEAAPAPEEPQPVATEQPAEEAVSPSWLEEGELPSGDDALAWLESLAAGKEEELRTAAEAEGKARMAEIMGRREEEEAAPAPEAEEPAAPPEMPDWLAERVEAAEEAGVEELEIEEPEVEPPFQPEAARVPDLVPGEAPDEEEAFGWTAFEAEEAEMEPLAAEAPGVEEVPAEPEAVVSEAMPPEREVEQPGLEPASPVEEEIVPGAPPEPTEEAEEIEAEPEEAMPAEEPSEGLDSLQAYVDAHPKDYLARLTLARELWHEGAYEESLEAYSRVLRSGKFSDEIVIDMEKHMEERPEDAAVEQLLGDAYMRVGELDKALKLYREALKDL